MLPRRRLRFSLPLCPPHTITHTLACSLSLSLSHLAVVVVHSRALCCCCCRVRVLHLNSPVLACHGSVTNDRDCHITFTHARTNYSRRTQPPSSPTYHFLCVCVPVCVYVRQCVNHTHTFTRAHAIFTSCHDCYGYRYNSRFHARVLSPRNRGG